MAWLTGIALVFLALVSLQFDRVSQAPSSIASVFDSAVLDSVDGDGDEPPGFRGDGLFSAVLTPVPAVTYISSTGFLPDDTPAKPSAFLLVSARGPPPAHI
ncbi:MULTISPECIES: hypothetical protein [unclassified Beijerinckia]|uniref:hypothetical protein n=1 Tax=unclassified Beijerinckia TaxID=2638183 RepID=UPI000B82D500|nr:MULTISPECIES: hypothetical protein [unclassified Beijerinckia]MDH7799579.1 hypothetical protein [Beijerinckia sp. GAS462]